MSNVNMTVNVDGDGNGCGSPCGMSLDVVFVIGGQEETRKWGPFAIDSIGAIVASLASRSDVRKVTPSTS